MRRLPIPLICLLLASATMMARAETITHTLQLNFINANESDDYFFDIPRFDPSLGTLNTVTETLSGDVLLGGTGSFRIDAEHGLEYIVTKSGPFYLSTTLPTSQNYLFTGTAGVIDSDYVQFLTVYREGTATITTVSPIVNTYQYNYTPAVSATAPEPASLVLLGTALLGVCARERGRSRLGR